MEFTEIKKQAVELVRAQEATRRLGLTIVREPMPSPRQRWGKKIAPLITRQQWEELIEHCDDMVPDYRGNIISFFEIAFDGQRLKDGSRIFH